MFKIVAFNTKALVRVEYLDFETIEEAKAYLDESFEWEEDDIPEDWEFTFDEYDPDDYDNYDDDYDECGFDPYEGCYTYDC